MRGGKAARCLVELRGKGGGSVKMVDSIKGSSG